MTKALTNPWLTYIAKETLPFRRFPFSGKSHPTTTRIIIPFRSTPSLEDASAQKRRLLTRTLCVIQEELIMKSTYVEYDVDLFLFSLWHQSSTVKIFTFRISNWARPRRPECENLYGTALVPKTK